MERIEEYLEAMLDIQEKGKRVVKTSDLAKKLNVKPSSVTEMLLKLSKKGYIEYQPYYGAVLTEKGKEVAKRIKKYHRIFEIFFRDFLGIDEEEAHRLSCELEHHVNDDIVAKVCRIIASECKLCEECEFRVLSLLDAEPGVYEVLICPSAMKMLGIKPNTTVKVKDKNVVEIEGEEFHVSPNVAEKTIIRKIPQG